MKIIKLFYSFKSVFFLNTFLALASCQAWNRHDMKTYLSDIHIALKDDYKTIKLENYGFSDATLVAQLVLSDSDKQAAWLFNVGLLHETSFYLGN